MSKALLIIDIQNDYFKGGNCELVNPQIASLNANKLLKNFRDKSLLFFIYNILVQKRMQLSLFQIQMEF